MPKQNAGRAERTWERLNRSIIACDRCPRLCAHSTKVAQEKRSAFRDWTYWGKPVPNFGDPRARLLIVGLAPAAHGGTRTGRVFTGDRSGEWLYRALHRAGFANQPHAVRRGDGLELLDCAITAACHCAPPGNKPLPDELQACAPFFAATFDALPVRGIIALGQIAWRAVIVEARSRRWWAGPMPKFGHGALVTLSENRWLLGSYHPSQQNTFTGKLTEPMFDSIFSRARRLLAFTQTAT